MLTKNNPPKEPYPSDLNDAEWALLRPLLPGPPRLGRPPRYDRRLVLNAIFYVVRSGCAWRLLPHDLPHCQLAGERALAGAWFIITLDQVRARRKKKAPSAALFDLAEG